MIQNEKHKIITQYKMKEYLNSGVYNRNYNFNYKHK